ncbi:MFS transporter [Lactobacillus sp. ESL0731]|uniref:MFS transporter n=1 Tax=unclassified Lactobacillus TaxID=2620435 RepID=UPI0023F9D17A|nr:MULTISPECIES: MFS transporter [unclassified Lactobacillus]WEV51225.1 MFS transporter [Lactobacillus sp. ESL0700]WEV62355.1 MFS transporter [Lactobacillus sp. ESL0731]
MGLIIFAWLLPNFAGLNKLIPVVLFTIIDCVCSDFSSTAYSASIHELVNEAKIQKLSSLTSTASAISSIFSPLLGVGLYAAAGFEVFIFFEIASSIISFLIMLSMKFHYQEPQREVANLSYSGQLELFKEGIAYIKKQPIVKGSILVGTVLNAAFASLAIGMPYVINTTLHLGNTPVGYLEMGSSIGVLVGSVLMSLTNSEKNARLKLMGPILIECLLLSGLGLVFAVCHQAQTLTVYGTIIMALLGCLIIIPEIVMQVEIQKRIPTEYLGRVSTTMSTINNSVSPIATLFFTALFQNIRQSYLIFIVTGIVTLIYMLAILPKIMQYFKEEGIE